MHRRRDAGETTRAPDVLRALGARTLLHHHCQPKGEPETDGTHGAVSARLSRTANRLKALDALLRSGLVHPGQRDIPL